MNEVIKLNYERLTGLQVIRQSQKRTGFDYWLGDEPTYGMQNLARREVSGILNGAIGQINRRLKEKMEQTKKSDNLSGEHYLNAFFKNLNSTKQNGIQRIFGRPGTSALDTDPGLLGGESP